MDNSDFADGHAQKVEILILKRKFNEMINWYMYFVITIVYTLFNAFSASRFTLTWLT
jgi:hypothetical protein